MATDHTAAFGTGLDRHGVGLTRTPADGAADAVADAVEAPAVGTPLPHDGVSLADVPGVVADPTAAELEAATTGVTAAALGIADHGSVVVEGGPDGEEPASLFVERHVAVLAASDLVADVPAAVEALAAMARDGRGDAVIATGPSATADMGELVLGAHGPRSVHVVLLEDR